MAKITIVVQDCRDQIAPSCEKEFRFERKAGRPPVNCSVCREFIKNEMLAKAAERVAAREAAKAAKVVEHDCNSPEWDCMFNNGVKEHHHKFKSVKCPCGTIFLVDVSGKGRKPTKCDACRDAGTVYRTNDDGTIDAIRAETLAEEQREIKDQNGKDRANALFERMQLLIEKDNRRRKLVAA